MHKVRILLAISLIVTVLTLAGCPQAGANPTGEDDIPANVSATVSVTADLAPAYDNGVAVDAVNVSLDATNVVHAFDLVVNAVERTATGSKTDVPGGQYSATVTMRKADVIVGHSTVLLSVTTDVHITVSVSIDTTGDPDGGSIGFEIE